MTYTIIDFQLNPIEPYRDLLVYALSNEGPYDSFEETRTGVKAYVPTDQMDEEAIRRAIAEECEGCSVSYTTSTLPDRNWNEEWERQHQPVLIDDVCWIRAPFHPHRTDVACEIEIEPKMSFGTGHHQTTYMMIHLMSAIQLDGQSVLDMGCGTAVLAIYASMRGAKKVVAIDNDEWAYSNSLENVERNHCSNIECQLGDASLLTANSHYDVILANINRNILLRDMPNYVAVLNEGGTLLLSGFYRNDVAMLTDKATTLGLKLEATTEREGWQALQFKKTV